MIEKQLFKLKNETTVKSLNPYRNITIMYNFTKECSPKGQSERFFAKKWMSGRLPERKIVSEWKKTRSWQLLLDMILYLAKQCGNFIVLRTAFDVPTLFGEPARTCARFRNKIISYGNKVCCRFHKKLRHRWLPGRFVEQRRVSCFLPPPQVKGCGESAVQNRVRRIAAAFPS